MPIKKRIKLYDRMCECHGPIISSLDLSSSLLRETHSVLVIAVHAVHSLYPTASLKLALCHCVYALDSRLNVRLCGYVRICLYAYRACVSSASDRVCVAGKTFSAIAGLLNYQKATRYRSNSLALFLHLVSYSITDYFISISTVLAHLSVVCFFFSFLFPPFHLFCLGLVCD